jgi:hypothetical protein
MVQYNPVQTLFADRNIEINQRKRSAIWSAVAERNADTADGMEMTDSEGKYSIPIFLPPYFCPDHADHIHPVG